MALTIAVLGIAAGAAWAVPTYGYSCVDLGGGLYGFTFFCNNTGASPSAWFVDMQWRGLTQAEADQYCWPGAIPGTIVQSKVFGVVDVHCEPDAIAYHNPNPPANYDMSLDTWVYSEFCHAFSGGTPIEGPNSFYVESRTAVGMQYVTVDHAYVVVDGSFAFEGWLGVDMFWPVTVSGVICIPEPATIAMLAIGSLMLIRRRR